MVDRVELLNFKLLRDVQVDLGRLNVFVGRNGVGKSSVLRGLDLVMWTHGLALGKDRQTNQYALHEEHQLAPVVSQPDTRVCIQAKLGRFGIQATGEIEGSNSPLSIG
ncbi:MAG: AAA family ATPase [Deltaproteobacteria bacterium]|nr:AAA family ATPase [Deltaproteobacteria bacterium]